MVDISTWGIFWAGLFLSIILVNLIDYGTRPFRQEEMKVKKNNEEDEDEE